MFLDDSAGNTLQRETVLMEYAYFAFLPGIIFSLKGVAQIMKRETVLIHIDYSADLRAIESGKGRTFGLKPDVFSLYGLVFHESAFPLLIYLY